MGPLGGSLRLFPDKMFPALHISLCNVSQLTRLVNVFFISFSVVHYKRSDFYLSTHVDKIFEISLLAQILQISHEFVFDNGQNLTGNVDKKTPASIPGRNHGHFPESTFSCNGCSFSMHGNCSSPRLRNSLWFRSFCG